MKSELPPPWLRRTVSEIQSENGLAGGPFGSSLGRKDYVADGVPVIRGTNLSGPGRFSFDDVVFVSWEKAERELNRNLAMPGDLVVTQRGTLGQVGVVPTQPYHRYVVSQSQMRLRVDPTVADRDFVYYVFRAEQTIREISRRAIATGVPHINLSILGSLPLPIPPLEEQRRIAALLRTLDDKIDSNRRLAELLEETAATAFRGRFVDYVGVEDFEDSRIGRVPRAWWLGDLTSVARFVNGKAFTKQANGQGLPVLRIKELNTGISSATPHADLKVADDYVARHHDILFAWSGSLEVYRWSGPEALINQHIFKVVPTGFPAWFVYHWVREHMAGFRAIARDKATTMGHIQRRHLSEAAVPLPPSEVIQAADERLGPIDHHEAALKRETRTLEQVRDTLLPKLISGEVRLPDTADPDEVIGPAAEELVT